MTGQNTSTAVMARRVEPPDSLDFYPTPPWATRALCEWLHARTPLHLMNVEDPCCGHGDMVRPLSEYFDRAEGRDVHDYSAYYPAQCGVEDYLLRDRFAAPRALPDWTFMNPPFKAAEEFIRMALRFSGTGVAALLRTSFLESEGRQSLFSEFPPTDVLHFAERVIMARGRLRDPAIPYWDAEADEGKGKVRKPSTATSYSWFVWTTLSRRNGESYEGGWIPKCRLRLERPGDYPPLPPEEQIPAGGLFT